MNPKLMVRLIPLFILLFISLLLASGLLNDPEKAFKDAPLVGYDMAPFSVPTLAAETERFAPRDWKGKVIVLNIFASWCKPCLEEHPVWMNLAKQGKANIYGLAWKDSPEKVSEWLNKHGNPYHLIGVDLTGITTIPLALTGVPETFILGQDGTIFYHHQAPITQEIVDKVIVPLVAKITAGELQSVRHNDFVPATAVKVPPTGQPAATSR